MLKIIRIGLLGLGTVGSGVATLIQHGQTIWQSRVKIQLEIAAIAVKSIEKSRTISVSDGVFTTDPIGISTRSDIDIIVDTMSDSEMSLACIVAGLKAGKPVVTANKAVVAAHMPALRAAAESGGGHLYFEAAVGGGIPIIRAIRTGYVANSVTQIAGILNGTTNYVLTAMTEDRIDRDIAVAKAQQLGFAEADPTMDVTGMDAAFKLGILAGVALGADVSVDAIYCEGIQDVTKSDIQYAFDLGYVVKLVAVGRKCADNQVSLMVAPMMVERTHPLAGVRNEYNAILIRGSAVGDAMLMGKGAGQLPTASAVMSDIVDIVAHLGGLSQISWDDPKRSVEVVSQAEWVGQFYTRLCVKDAAGVLEKIIRCFSQHQISVQHVVQHPDGIGYAGLILVTHAVNEAQMQQALADIRTVSEVKGIGTTLRLLDLDAC